MYKYNIEKIKTIGDAYLCASGLSEKKDPLAAVKIIDAAKEVCCVFLAKLNEQKDQPVEKYHFNIRIGIHSGPVIAGVVQEK